MAESLRTAANLCHGPPALDLRHWTSRTGPPALDLLHWTSGTRPPALDFWHWTSSTSGTSGTGPPALDLQHWTSSTSGTGPPALDIRHFRHWTSSTGPPSLDLWHFWNWISSTWHLLIAREIGYAFSRWEGVECVRHIYLSVPADLGCIKMFYSVIMYICLMGHSCVSPLQSALYDWTINFNSNSPQLLGKL